jgi:hypothetical protein
MQLGPEPRDALAVHIADMFVLFVFCLVISALVGAFFLLCGRLLTRVLRRMRIRHMNRKCSCHLGDCTCTKEPELPEFEYEPVEASMWREDDEAR